MWKVRYKTPIGTQWRTYKLAEEWEVRRKTPKNWQITMMTKEY